MLKKQSLQRRGILRLCQFLCGNLNGRVGGFYFTSQPQRKAYEQKAISLP